MGYRGSVGREEDMNALFRVLYYDDQTPAFPP